ncbi:hypothetical protein AJ79_01620 [Helicocarpus griseus UAMH5409]|uniref:Uncharacterized protein n=1 Tax=Helicocarpus griseus UAMH5409 TaxID=1447875 RepID=A0A2B7Y808_9EURO|nr:hypothetical protein AJ79_01620 [Helicocarpus griseus UAMH5409]
MERSLDTVVTLLDTHRRRKVSLYIRRNAILQQRKIEDAQLATKRKREDEEFMQEVGRVEGEQKKLREERMRLECGLSKEEMAFLVGEPAEARMARRGREIRRELRKRIQELEAVARKSGVGMDTRSRTSKCYPARRCQKASNDRSSSTDSDESEPRTVSNVKREDIKRERVKKEQIDLMKVPEWRMDQEQ